MYLNYRLSFKVSLKSLSEDEMEDFHFCL